jgi:hypothetical protein
MAEDRYYDYPQDARNPPETKSRHLQWLARYFFDCPLCHRPMVPVHGHYECRGPSGCGYRDSCCDGGECT